MILSPFHFSMGLLTLVVLLYFYRHRKYFALIMRLPGPTSFPIIGDIWFLCKNDMMLGATEKLPHDIFRILAFPSIIVVSKLEDMETICKNTGLQHRGEVGDGFIAILGANSVVTLSHPASLKPKKILMRTFAQTDSDLIMSRFRKEFQTLKVVLDSQAYFDSTVVFRTYTLSSIIGTCLTPVSEKELTDLEKILSPIWHFTETAVFKAVSPLHRNEFLFNNLFGGNRLNTVLRTYYSYGDRIINNKRAELSVFNKRGENPPNVYIYKLLQEMPHASNEEILCELLTVIVGGLETSARTASIVAVVLGILPDIQQKVYEEGCAVRREENTNEMTEESLTKCLYLSRVVKEAQRMYPTVPLFPRMTKKEIQFGKYTVPSGTMVLGATFALHRDATIFEDPLTFNPDRFLPENFAKIPKHAYLPFGQGPRSCPGYRYGTMSVMFLTSNLVHSYKIHTKHQSIKELDANLTIMTNLSEKKGFPLRMSMR